MDCMEAMREMPDKCFDLAIVDPPYGIGEDGGVGIQQGGRVKRSNGTFGYITREHFEQKDWDRSAPSDEYFTELKRVSVNQIVWGGNYFDLPPTKGVICWDKNQLFPNFSAWEMAWTSFDHVARIFKFDNKGFMGEGAKIHPTQKPVALYKWLLTNYAKPGDTILDTHLGSGSSRIAAYDLGFDFTGFELDAEYFAAQEERFANHIAQPKLFAPEPVRVEQSELFGG